MEKRSFFTFIKFLVFVVSLMNSYSVFASSDDLQLTLKNFPLASVQWSPEKLKNVESIVEFLAKLYHLLIQNRNSKSNEFINSVKNYSRNINLKIKEFKTIYGDTIDTQIVVIFFKFLKKTGRDIRKNCCNVDFYTNGNDMAHIFLTQLNKYVNENVKLNPNLDPKNREFFLFIFNDMFNLTQRKISYVLGDAL